MKRLAILLLLLMPAWRAGAAPPPGLAVTLAPLQPGSLPRIITIYGRVGATAPARWLVMAPLAAVVQRVFVHTGALVAAGAPLLRLAPSPASRAAYDRALAAQQVARQLVARTGAMAASHLATAQQLADARTAAADAATELRALTAEGADRPRVLRAAAAGIVARIDTAPGAIVGPGAPLLALVRPDGLVLKAGVVPGMAQAIDPRQPVRLIPVGGGPVQRGQVLFRAALVDPANGLVPVAIALGDRRPLLGEMFRADITIGTAHGYLVPHRAVLVDRQGAPYVVQARHRRDRLIAHRVAVRILAETGAQDIVSGPLLAQDPVVVEGNYQAREGSPLRLAVARPGAGG